MSTSSSQSDEMLTKQADTISRENHSLGNEPSSDIDTNKNYNNYLCTDNEEVLFSFKTEESGKTVSVCFSKKQPDYIVYRFGTKENIELEFPASKDDSWNKFVYSYYLRGGGKENEGMDLNYLSFENGGYKFQIYQEYIANDDITRVGISVKEEATNKETDIKGLSNSVVGSLVGLKDNKKIKIENL